MDNYDRDDAFFATVNKNKDVRDRVVSASTSVEKSFEEFYKKSARAEAAVARENERKKQIERTNKIRVMAVVGALIALLGSGILTASIYGDDIGAAIVEKSDYDKAIDILSKHHWMVFHARELANGGILNNNSISQYKDLNITTMEEVYVYLYESKFKFSTNFDEEMAKLICSVSYYDDDGNVCFYENFEHFLEDKGFKSEKEFKEAARTSIIAKYRSGEIKPRFYDGIGTANMPRGRG